MAKRDVSTILLPDEALRLATQMDAWREAAGGGKVPD
jgi:hypothetical protein